MPEAPEPADPGTFTLFFEVPDAAGREVFARAARARIEGAVAAYDPKRLAKGRLADERPAERRATLERAAPSIAALGERARESAELFARWGAARPVAAAAPKAGSERLFREIVVADLRNRQQIERVERALTRPSSAELGSMRTPEGASIALVAQTGHSAAIRAVAFAEGGARLVTASEDGRAIAWDAATGREVYTWWLAEAGLREMPAAVALSADRRTLAVTGDAGTVARWTEGEVPRVELPGTAPPPGTPAPVGVVALPERGARVKALPVSEAARAAVARIEGVTAAALSPDASAPYLVVGTAAGSITAVHRDTGEVAWRAGGVRAGVTDVAFAAEGASFTVSTEGGDVYTWDATVGRPAGARAAALAKKGGGPAALPEPRLREALRRRLRAGGSIRRLAVRRADDARPRDGQVLVDRATGMPIGFHEPRRANEVVLAEVSEARDRLLALHADGSIAALERATGRGEWLAEGWLRWSMRAPRASAASLSADGRFALLGLRDGVTQLLDAGSGERRCHVIALPDGAWAVSTDEGRYDAPSGGTGASLHWVVNGEPLALDQLKARYFEPFLLSKLLGTRAEPLRAIAPFDGKLPPRVTFREEGGALVVTAVERGAGIGSLRIAVNGKEALACRLDASGAVVAERMPFEVWWSAEVKRELATTTLECRVRLAGHPYVRRGARPKIAVTATDRDEGVSSRQIGDGDEGPAEGPPRPSTLWAIVAGISDYGDPSRSLAYAASDAESFAAAVRLAAPGVFADRVKLTVLTSPGALAPTYENLKAAFATASAATSDDVLLVYLAGHGDVVRTATGDDDFFYPTAGGPAGSPRQEGVTGAALEEWIGKIPALKQVLLLDTCHSGQLVRDLGDARDAPAGQERALERLRDGTGLFILAGAAADAVSYETSRYGMGLLTYALLLGLKEGKPLRDRFVDVLGLMTYATAEVEALAEEIDRVQRPILSLRDQAVSFDIGKVDLAAAGAIPLAAARPVLARCALHDADLWCDPLRLGPSLDEALRAAASATRDPPFVVVDCPFLDGAILVTGQYRAAADSLQVRLRIVRDEAARFEVERAGTTDAAGLAALIDALTADVIGALPGVLATPA